MRPQLSIRQVLHNLIAVVTYRRPEAAGSIILPPAYEEDSTHTLWEVVQASPQAEEHLGVPLPPGSILTTLTHWPVDSGHVDENGREVFFLKADSVLNIILYEE